MKLVIAGVLKGDWLAFTHLAFLLILPVGACVASPPAETIKGYYHHTAWMAKDGAPAGVWSIAQSADGWLWLGSFSGLWRFDGVQFDRLDLRPPGSTSSRSVASVFAARNGDVWASFSYGGAVLLRRDDRTHPVPQSGLPPNDTISGFTEEADGHIWAATTSNRLFVFDGVKWHSPDRDWGLPEQGDIESLLDVSGSFWIATSDGIYVRAPGASRFERTLPDRGFVGRSHSGIVWGKAQGGFRILSTSDELKSATVPYVASSEADLLDRSSAYWSVDCGATGGVCRASPLATQPIISSDDIARDSFGAADGLSSNRAMTLLEDHEGSIWVGTRRGLDRFRRNDLIAVSFPHFSGGYLSVVAPAGGGIWAGTESGYPSNPDAWWQLDPLPTRVAGFQGPVSASFIDQDGSILFGSGGQMWRSANGVFEHAPTPPMGEAGATVQAIERDGLGRLWISVRKQGVYRLNGSEWLKNGGLTELPAGAANVMARDDVGRLWLGYSGNRVSLIQGDHARTFSESDGLRTGPVSAILPGRPTLIAGTLGLFVMVGEGFRPMNGVRTDVLTGITGMVRTADHALWLNGNLGAVRIGANDFERGLADQTFAMPARVFNEDDGMPGGAQEIRPLPTLVQDGRGRLWFVANDGLAWVDPQALQHNELAPQVEIRSIETDKETYPIPSEGALAAGTRSVKISYTALSLAVPSRMHFRVRLGGIDRSWREMGNERSASYSNLSPGKYAFEVEASNNDGIWSPIGASAGFSIQPSLYQTTGFRAACALSLAAGLFWFFQWQGRRLAVRAASRVGVRLRERERIARELHDTLLQDVEALLLNLRTLPLHFDDPIEAKRMVANLSECAESSLEEARSRVSGLRAEARSVSGLAEVMGELADQLTHLYPLSYRLHVSGDSVPLHSILGDDIVAIGREAILNSFRHSQGSRVTISIQYGTKALGIKVADDGRGMSPQPDQPSDKTAHWGIIGMRERARNLRAQLEILATDQGTSVRLNVPASMAYTESRSLSRWRRSWLSIVEKARFQLKEGRG